MTSRRRFLGTAAYLTGLAATSVKAQAPRPDPPVAKRVVATDDYYGTIVSDPYRWMENSKDPDFLPWLKAQDNYTRSFFAQIPGRAALRMRVSELSGDLSVTRKVVASDRRLFYEQRTAGAQNFKLLLRDEDRPTKTLVDPTALKFDGKHVSLDWWEPAPGGRYVAYGLSAAGSEASTGHVMEVATGRILNERIPNIDYGITGWLSDGLGFFYIQFTGERGTPNFYWDSVVKLHTLNTDPTADRIVLKRGLYPQIPMNEIQVGAVRPVIGTDRAIVMVLDVRPERSVWTVKISDLLAGKPHFHPIATLDDLVVGVAATTEDLFVISNRDRPRGRVLVTSLSGGSLQDAKEILPQSNLVAEDLYPTRSSVVVRMMDGGVQRLIRLTRDEPPTAIKLPYDGAVRGVFSSEVLNEVYVSLTGWLQPPAIWQVTAKAGVDRTDLDGKAPFDLSQYIAERRFASARDGTQVPYTIVARRGWRANASNPVLATAYGAYQYSLTPRLNPPLLAFLDAGGIYVVANVRGGGEYGREWHKAGQKATKPNTWRDFIDVASALISSDVTSSKHLVIQGTSAGGVTVGRALTERPDLFAGAISDVGWLNPIRYSVEQNSSDIDEWGPIVDAASFRIMYEMDSYHAVKDGVRYPPVLVQSGYEDPRVATFHAGKFVARLQSAGAGGPVFLRMDFEAGHGIGSTREQRDALFADIYSFVLWCAGAKGFNAPSGSVALSSR